MIKTRHAASYIVFKILHIKLDFFELIKLGDFPGRDIIVNGLQTL